MNNGYKFLGMVMAAAGLAFGADAANPTIVTTPPAGTLNLDYYTFGFTSVELDQQGYINRESDGFVTLTRNGEEVSRIPATNVKLMYCVTGFDKTNYGNPHVDFWKDPKSTEGLVPGEYTVTFDEGVVLFSQDMVPNDAFSVTYQVPGSGMTFTPAEGSYLAEISKIVISFAEGAKVTYKGGTNGIVLDNLTGTSGAKFPKVEVDGNEAVLTFEDVLTEEGTYWLDINANAFSWTLDGQTYSNPKYSANFNVVDYSYMPTVIPAPGSYTQFDGIVKDGEVSSSFFKCTLPEGKTLMYANEMVGCYLYPLKADGSMDTSVKSYRFQAFSDPDDNTYFYLNSVTAQKVLKPTPGEYMLFLGGDSFTTSDGHSNSPMSVAKYVITEGEEAANFTITPDFKQEVSELSSVTLDFPAGSEVKWLNGNYVWISNGVTQYALTPVVDGNKLTVDVKPVISQEGTWELTIAQSALTVDGQPTPVHVNYTVGGSGAVEEGVVYDIKMTGFKPCTSANDPTVDLEMKNFEMVQMVFNMSGLQPVEGAQVRIAGPGYNQVSTIMYGFGTDQNTTMKAPFGSDPIYNGTYTVTIAKGSVGDAAYIADHNAGHANEEVNYVFECIGGKDVSEMGVDTSLAMSSSIALSSTVESLENLSLNFDEKVYFNPNTVLQVKYRKDLAAVGSPKFGTATLTRVSDTEVKVVFDPEPVATNDMAQYILEIPEGTFWNEEHELDSKAGKVNGTAAMSWYLWIEVKYVDVVSTTPENDEYVEQFATGEGIVFDTTDNDAVASMEISLYEFKIDDYMDPGTVLLNGVVSSSKTESGEPCWINEGEAIVLDENCWYEADADFYNADGTWIGSGSIVFYGKGSAVGVAATAAEMNQVVYNLQGIRVAESVKNIPAGLYIIGGKKIVKK